MINLHERMLPTLTGVEPATCDFHAYARTIFLLCCKFQIILETVAVVETQTLLCHVYKAKFLSKSKLCNSSNKNLIRILYPSCTCPFSLCCKFQIIILKTKEVAKTRTLLFHEYKAEFLRKFRGCYSSNKNLISFMTFMHMPSLYSYFTANFKSLS